MKNWKNAEIIELDINMTADGRFPLGFEAAPHTVIGVWVYGANDGKDHGQTQDGDHSNDDDPS